MQLVKSDAPILRKVCRPDSSITADQVSRTFVLIKERGGLGLAARRPVLTLGSS